MTLREAVETARQPAAKTQPSALQKRHGFAWGSQLHSDPVLGG